MWRVFLNKNQRISDYKKDEIRKRNNEYRNNTENMKISYDIDYRQRNREEIQLYMKYYFQNIKKELFKKIKEKKMEDFNFRLTCGLRKRVLNAFKARNVRKRKKTFDLLGCSHSFLRLWIDELYGEMTLEIYDKIWCLEHCLAVATLNILDETEMKKCFNWIYSRPMYVEDNNIKSDKIDTRLCLLQEIKANCFMKFND